MFAKQAPTAASRSSSGFALPPDPPRLVAPAIGTATRAVGDARLRPSRRRRPSSARSHRSDESARSRPCGHHDIVISWPAASRRSSRSSPPRRARFVCAAVRTAADAAEAATARTRRASRANALRAVVEGTRARSRRTSRGRDRRPRNPARSRHPWAPPVPTSCDGTFRLSLPAPGSYGFLLVWNGRSASSRRTRGTPRSSRSPSRPDETRARGSSSSSSADEWRAISETAPADTPSCP